MSSTRYTDEFKAEAVKQVTEHGHGAIEFGNRLTASQCNRVAVVTSGFDSLLHMDSSRSGKSSQSDCCTAICYEQLLTYSVLWMMIEDPDVLVGASNLWWVVDKTIPVIQDQMMLSYGRLFGVAVVRAVNA